MPRQPRPHPMCRLSINTSSASFWHAKEMPNWFSAFTVLTLNAYLSRERLPSGRCEGWMPRCLPLLVVSAGGGNTLPPPRALPSVFAANIRQTFPAEVCSWCAAGRIRNQSHRAPTHGGPMTICVRRRPWRSSNCWFPRFKTCSAAPRKTRVRELTRAATMADPARCH